MSGVLVGVDAGSTRVKAVVVDCAGTALSAAAEPTPWVVTGANVEMDPGALADTVRRVITSALDALGALDASATVIGVGVTGIGESGVLLDRHGEPVAPIIAWHDQRGDVAGIARELPDLPARTGIPFNPTATIFKLTLQLPGAAGSRWLNVPEWIVRCLGGEEFAEMSLAGRTGLQDLHTGRWWGDALELLGVDESLFPGDARFGVDGAGQATFAPIAGARLVVGGHDHQVAAFVTGAIEPGCLFESLGTADALTFVVPIPVEGSMVVDLTSDGTTIGRTVVADRVMAIIGLRTGQVLDRIARLVGLDGLGGLGGPDVEGGMVEGGSVERRALSERAAVRTPDAALTVSLADGLLTIAGIGPGTDAADLWAAAVAAADVRTAAVTARFARLLGPATSIVLGGGWLNDPTVEAATRRRFPGARRSRYGEPGAVGAACMAGISAGVLDAPFPSEVHS